MLVTKRFTNRKRGLGLKFMDLLAAGAVPFKVTYERVKFDCWLCVEADVNEYQTCNEYIETLKMFRDDS
jgi:hypothetical protein